MRRMTMVISFVLMLGLVLSACGGGNTGSNGGETNAGNTNTGSTDSGPATELTVAYFTFGNTPADLAQVQDELSRLAKEKINATVKLLPISIGAWNQQMNLMLTSNEKLDLILTGSSATLGYAPQVSKGQLLPLNELLDQHGQGIKEAVGDAFIQASSIDGKIYGVPSIRDLAVNYGVLIRKDLADKYGIDPSAINSIDALEGMMKTLKENEPNIAPIAPGVAGASIAEYLYTLDRLGDGYGVLLNNGQDDLKVINYYETEEYAALVKRIRGWYQAGYILKDAATNKEGIADLIKAGRAAAYVANLKPGVEMQESRMIGTEIAKGEITEPVAKTETVTNIMWGIPRNATNPEASMKLLNLLYTDKDFINTIDWGIEGKHYAKTDQENVIKYADGVDANSSGYNPNTGWMFGNQFLSYTFEGDNPDIWKETDEFNKNAIKSKALGFTFDSSPVKTEFASVTNVMNQYRLGLETGTLDPDKALPDFIAKLKSAGIDKIVAEKQKQLDAWAASK